VTALEESGDLLEPKLSGATRFTGQMSESFCGTGRADDLLRCRVDASSMCRSSPCQSRPRPVAYVARIPASSKQAARKSDPVLSIVA